MVRTTRLPRWLVFSVLATLIAASFSLILLYQVQESTKNHIKQSLFEKAKAEQIKTTRTIAGKISSDLDSIVSKLGQLAATPALQEGRFTTATVDRLVNDKLDELKSLYAVDDVFIINDKGILVNINRDNNFGRFVGLDISSREYVKEVIQSRAPVFSNWYVGSDGNSRITAIYPIVDVDTGKLVGAVGASVIANPFFSRYGNIYEFNSSQYINVLDRNAVFAASPNPSIVGLSFYDDKVQSEFVKHDPIVNEFYGKLLSGKASDAMFDVGFGERLVTGQPVTINAKPVYFLTVGIPTSVIYSDIDAILASQNSLNYFQWIALLVAIGFILLFLLRLNNRLNHEVSRRTEELALANAELRKANDKLEIHDKLQREFINIAAHELRTPITPILVALHLAQKVKTADGESQTILAKGQAEMIERNAKRLGKLANDVLTVTRIEGMGLYLHKEPVNMNEKISRVVSDIKTFTPPDKKIDFIFEPSRDAIIVEADTSKLFEVLANLLRNAIRFTDESGGRITITLDKEEVREEIQDGKIQTKTMAIIRIKDNGKGIDPEILPRLFQKFAASQDLGATGLGLYISKSIVEAHGGKIWAENNNDGKGATFSFTLPLKQ